MSSSLTRGPHLMALRRRALQTLTQNPPSPARGARKAPCRSLSAAVHLQLGLLHSGLARVTLEHMQALLQCLWGKQTRLQIHNPFERTALQLDTAQADVLGKGQHSRSEQSAGLTNATRASAADQCCAPQDEGRCVQLLRRPSSSTAGAQCYTHMAVL